MSGVLFLTHRIPLPPNKGDKIRSYHWLQALRRDHEVYVATFVDAHEDLAFVPELRSQCAEAYVARLRPTLRRLWSARGLLTGDPLTLAYYSDRGLRGWVEKILRSGRVDRVVVFSSSMAQFVDRAAADGMRCIIDFCDVDSDKWAQYAARRGWPLDWIYRRESARLCRSEQDLAQRFDASVFVSAQEAGLFQRLTRLAGERIGSVGNGVDIRYFDPAAALASPFAPEQRAIVFTGAMDYWANIEAVTWFAHEILPLIRKTQADSWFYIVGSNPPPAVQRLARLEGIRVTGRVPDVRPYLQHACAAVAPLRIARGVQNKVLEAMAMGRHIVATSAAVAGLDIPPPEHVYVEDGPAGFAARVAALLQRRPPPFSQANRNFVLEHFDWARQQESFLRIVAGAAAEPRTVSSRSM